jgi:hypothetical protein
VAWSRVELFEQIRKDRRAEGASIRELADRHHVHRRTVRQAIDNAVPPPRKPYPQRPRPAIDAYVAVIDGWLTADKHVPRKQRHTARRIWQRLVAEHGAALSEMTVSRYVARRKAELGLDRVEVSVPPQQLPGAEEGLPALHPCPLVPVGGQLYPGAQGVVSGTEAASYDQLMDIAKKFGIEPADDA